MDTSDHMEIPQSEKMSEPENIESSLPSASLVLPELTQDRDEPSSEMESCLPTSSVLLDITVRTKDKQSPKVLESSLSSTSFVQMEITEARDEPNSGMEPSLAPGSVLIPQGDERSQTVEPSLFTSSSEGDAEISKAEDVHNSEIVEFSLPTTSFVCNDANEGDDKPGPESSSLPGSSSSEEFQVNPIIEKLKLDYPGIGRHKDFNLMEKVLQNEYPRLKKELRGGLKKIQVNLEDGDMKRAMEQVGEVLNKFHAIQYLRTEFLPIPQFSEVMKDIKEKELANDIKENKRAKKDDDGKQPINEITELLDVYKVLFTYALVDYNNFKELSTGHVHDFNETKSSWKRYKRTGFMVFLVKKVQKDTVIMDGLGKPTDLCVVTQCISEYEKESFAACILYVRRGELIEATKMLKETIKSMKRDDKLIIKRGHLYNSVLQEAIGDQVQVAEVEFLKPKDQVQVVGDQLQILPKDPEHKDTWSKQRLQDLTKVPDYFVDLFLEDEDFMIELTFDWMEKNKYPYLILCVWECHARHKKELRHCFEAGVDQESILSRTNLRPTLVTSKSCTSTGKGRDSESKHAQFPTKPGLYAVHSAVLISRQDIIEKFRTEWPDLDINETSNGITALHVAVYKGYEEMLRYLLKDNQLDINARTAREEGNNMWELPKHRTALHIATEHGYAKMVELLCRDENKSGKQSIRCHEEDDNKITALDIVYEKLKPEVRKECCYQHTKRNCATCSALYEDIEKILLSMEDVQKGVDRLYRNRQVHVDAANTILVGAALIASVTFAGWLQPPLGYAEYYEFPTPSPAPPGTYDSYIGVGGNVGIQAFALFNSLSFFFAIATVIVGADAAFPMERYKYIGHVVQTMQLLLRRAIKLLMLSLLCVLGAFSSGAMVILPPQVHFRRHLIFTIFIGGGLCSILLWQLLTRHSHSVQKLNDRIIQIISKYTNTF